MTAAPRGPTDGPGLDARNSGHDVRDLYDRWARVYDWNPVLRLVRPARRRAVEALALSAGDTVVDMGTGTGANLRDLREAVGPTGHVVGVDISPRMLARARSRVERNGWRNVTLVEADIRDPPVEGRVDAVLSAFVVVMYADPAHLVEAWADRLDPGAIANLYAGPSRRWYGPAANALLSVYLRVFEEGWDLPGGGPGPLEMIGNRGERASEAVAAWAAEVEHEDLVFGLTKLDVGRSGGIG